MARSQRHKRFIVGKDSSGSTKYPGSSYLWDWANIWPSGPAIGVPTAPAPFGVGDWSVATGSGPREVVVTINSLPSNGGSLITTVQYDLNGSQLWVDIGLVAPGSVVLVLPAAATAYDIRLRAVNGIGSGAPSVLKSVTSAADVPAAFADGAWSVATGTSPTAIDVTINSLPTTNGSPITDVLYDVDGSGTWVSLGTAVPGTETLLLPLVNTSYGLRLRAVNAVGQGAVSSTKNAVSGAGTPSAFVDANWSVATGSGSSELDITIASLPNANGAAITDIQYDVDGSGTWVSLGTASPGTVTVTMAAASTSYDIRLRAVNSAGAGPAGNTETATSGAGAPTAPDAFVDANWSVATGSGFRELSITVASLPANNGAAITDLQYDVNGNNTWTSLGAATTGTYQVSMALPATSYDIRLRAVNSAGSGPAGNTESANSSADVPDTFVDANWSVATGSAGAELDITIVSLPSNNGAAITDIEYDVDGSGTWISLVATSTGTYTVTMASASTLYDLRLRAVNSKGAGAAGNTESATSGASATAPAAFVDANWSVATGSAAAELDITIASLPSNGGSAITDVQYDVDGNGTWTSLPGYAGTGAYTVTMAAASTLYGIRLRAVNAVGAGPAGNTESANSGAGAATAPAAFVDANWSVATGTGVSDLDINVASLPSNGGSAITDIEYDVDGADSWTSVGGATAGTYTVTMAAASTSYGIRLRAVNAVGTGAAGNTENATSAAPTITGYSYNGTDTITMTTNGPGVVYSSTTVASQTNGSDIEAGTGAIDVDSDPVVLGSNNISVAYPNTYGTNYLNVAFKSGGAYATVSNQYVFPDIVPRAFVDSDWSVATGAGAAELDITIATLPDNGGTAITDIEYDVDGNGTWVSVGGATTGTYTVTMAAASTSYGIRLRAVNSVGNGLVGNTETATSGAAATVPAAFVDANWSVATGSGSSELDITIASLPANGGAAITDVQYDVDSSGTWISLPSYSGTGTYTVTMAAASTLYGIRLRAVNSAGTGPAGNTENATSGSAAAGIAYVQQSSVDDPHPAANPLTLSHTPAASGNMLVLIFNFESTSTSLDTSLGSGGANIPTWNGVTMTFQAYRASSRRHCCIYTAQASTVSSADFSVSTGMRGASLTCLEYSGVDLTTPVNATGDVISGGANITPTLTTVDPNGLLVGAATFGDELTASSNTTGTLRREGASGTADGSRDIRLCIAEQAVVSTGASEGITFNQPGNSSAAAAIIELNPA